MIMERIRLRNYRQYVDVDLEFADPDSGKGFTLIRGTTGAGKTNLLNAINWCLFADEPHLGLQDTSRGLPKVNTCILAEASVDKMVKTEVEIIFREEENRRLSVKRIATFRKKKSKYEETPFKGSKSKDGSKLAVSMELPNGNWEPVEGDPEEFVKSKIPQTIREYFFFDGERLNDYIQDDSPREIKEAVFRISQLELLDRVATHLRAIRQKYTDQEPDEVAKDLKNIEKEIEKLNKSILDCEGQLEDYGREINAGKKKIEEISNRIKEIGTEDIEELEEKRKSLLFSLTTFREQIDRIKTSRLQQLLNAAPSILAGDAIRAALLLIDGKRREGQMKPHVTEDLLKELLEDTQTCICGADLSTPGPARSKIQERLDSLDMTNRISYELWELEAFLKTLSMQSVDFEKEYSDRVRQLQFLEEREIEVSRDLKTTQERLDEYEQSDIRELVQLRNDMEKSIKETENKVIELKAQKIVDESEHKRLTNRLETRAGQEKKLRRLNRVYDLCNKTMEAAAKLKANIMKEIKDEIEKRTSKQFKKLVWKERTFREIMIDDDYQISVIHQSGFDTLGTISAGERQAMALSFLSAVNSVSGFRVPIVIDTPLARIDLGEPREYLARSLAELLGDRQLVLLVTNAEYTSEVEEELGKHVGRDYTIRHTEHEEGGTSEVLKT